MNVTIIIHVKYDVKLKLQYEVYVSTFVCIIIWNVGC